MQDYRTRIDWFPLNITFSWQSYCIICNFTFACNQLWIYYVKSKIIFLIQSLKYYNFILKIYINILVALIILFWFSSYSFWSLTLCFYLHIIIINTPALFRIAKFYNNISIHCTRVTSIVLYRVYFAQFMWNKSLASLRDMYVHCRIARINEGEITIPSTGALNQSNAVSCHFGVRFLGQVNFRLRVIFLILDYRRRGYRSRHLRIKWKGRLAMGFDRWNEFSMEAEIEDLERRSKRPCGKQEK